MNRLDHAYGFVDGEKIYRSAWNEYPERLIGSVKDDDVETSLQYFEARFHDLEQKILQLEERIAADENKGSFMVKLLHDKKTLPEHDGLGNYATIDAKLDSLISQIQEIIDENRKKNLATKTTMLEEAKAAAQKVSWYEATDELRELKERWIRTGSAPESENQKLEDEFWEVITDFKKRKSDFYEDKKRLSQHYEIKYRDIVDESKQLGQIPWKSRRGTIDTLREKWRENGAVPSEVYQPLLQEFNAAIKQAMMRPNDDGKIEALHRKLTGYTIEDRPAKKDLQADLGEIKRLNAKNGTGRQKKQTCFAIIFKYLELNYVDETCSRRFQNFSEMSQQEQGRSRVKVVRELLERDRSDLQTYESNLGNFSTRDESVMEMMKSKVQQQKRKIQIKEAILKELMAIM